jgi:cyclic pyranopterin phosphate synthase
MPAEIFHDNFQFLPKSELLSYEEIVRLSKIFAGLGVKKLRLTGGEPLLRRDLTTLISNLFKIEGIEDIGLTTNGVFLKKTCRKFEGSWFAKGEYQLGQPR